MLIQHDNENLSFNTAKKINWQIHLLEYMFNALIVYLVMYRCVTQQIFLSFFF